MDWNTISQISTAFSTVVGAGSLIAMYRIYYSSKKDESIRNIRLMISTCASNCKKLNYLATHQLLHEISFCAIYRDDVKNMIANLLKALQREDLNKFQDKEVLRKFVEKNIPSITIPVTSDLTREYRSIIQETQIEIEKYRFNFPGLYKVIDTLLLVFQSLLSVNISIIDNDDIWAAILTDCLSNKEIDVDPETLHSKLHEYMTGILLHRFNEQKDQSDIDDMLEIIEIVTIPYLGLNDNKLFRQAKKESKIQLIANNKLFTGGQMTSLNACFLEAEKALKTILSQEDLLRYRTKVTAYYERMKMQSEK